MHEGEGSGAIIKGEERAHKAESVERVSQSVGGRENGQVAAMGAVGSSPRGHGAYLTLSAYP